MAGCSHKKAESAQCINDWARKTSFQQHIETPGLSFHKLGRKHVVFFNMQQLNQLPDIVNNFRVLSSLER